jgi:hypothetical protein
VISSAPKTLIRVVGVLKAILVNVVRRKAIGTLLAAVL